MIKFNTKLKLTSMKKEMFLLIIILFVYSCNKQQDVTPNNAKSNVSVLNLIYTTDSVVFSTNILPKKKWNNDSVFHRLIADSFYVSGDICSVKRVVLSVANSGGWTNRVTLYIDGIYVDSD